MCGVLGLWDSKIAPGETHALLDRGLEKLTHRGPDARGVTVLEKDGVGLGHCRLAILDLDPRSNQPMAFPPHLHISFNGEIYNFQELREALIREGHTFHTTGDTEVLLKGYAQWGLESLLQRCAGMFAFALYDARIKKLFLARDRAGKKPLFYGRQGPRFVFGSEIGALLSLWPRRPAVDPGGMEAWLHQKFVPPPRTLFRDVEKVPPGSYAAVSPDGTVDLRPYWSPWSTGRKAPSSPRDEVDRSLTRAVERRLVSDVPVSVFLSGGLDSSLIVAKAVQSGAKNLRCYNIGYKDIPACNEQEYAREVAERYKVDYQELWVDSHQALEVLEDPRWVLDEPIADWVWVPLFMLSQRVKSDGYKVVLTGEGGDEVFFGYDPMRKGFRQIQRWSTPTFRRLAQGLSAVLAPVYQISSRGHRRYDFLTRVGQGGPIYDGSSPGFPPTQRRHVAGPRLKAEPPEGLSPRFIAELTERYVRESPLPRDPVGLISYIEFRTKMVEILLQRMDRITMLHGVEARCPFLDHDLVELAFSLPGEVKAPRGDLKQLLKKVAEPFLSPGLIHRKKMGFSFPFKDWLRGPLSRPVEDVFLKSRLFKDGWVRREFALSLWKEHVHRRVDHAPRIWALHTLARWYDRWVNP